MALTHGIRTPQDKIRKTASVSELSHEKKSRPKNKCKVKRKSKSGKKKTAVKAKVGNGGAEAVQQATGPPSTGGGGKVEIPPSSTEPGPGDATPATQYYSPGSKEPTECPGKIVQAAPSDPPPPKATAAKSAATPPTKTEPTRLQVKHELETPGSVRREQDVQQAMSDNLARASTQEQLAVTQSPQQTKPTNEAAQQPAQAPSSSPPTTGGPAPNSEAKTQAPDEDDDENVKMKGERKKRRAKTAQEKANHARFMRFTRHIQSHSDTLECKTVEDL